MGLSVLRRGGKRPVVKLCSPYCFNMLGVDSCVFFNLYDKSRPENQTKRGEIDFFQAVTADTCVFLIFTTSFLTVFQFQVLRCVCVPFIPNSSRVKIFLTEPSFPGSPQENPVRPPCGARIQQQLQVESSVLEPMTVSAGNVIPSRK